MYIDKENFEAWMERIMDRLDMQDKKIDRLLNSQNCLDGEKLLDNQDLCELLNTSKRSIQRYRSSGTLKYQMLWHKVYYKESDVQEFLKNHFDEFKGCRKVEKGRG